jgi:hypothetical protein
LKGVSQLWMRRRLISRPERRWLEAHICELDMVEEGFNLIRSKLIHQPVCD